MKEPSTALFADLSSAKHDTGPGHPECRERYHAVMRGLNTTGLLDSLQRLPPRVATDEELAACHTPEYIALVRREIAAGAQELSSSDTAVSAASLDAALIAAGGALNAVDTVVAGRARNAFCCVRPPGHHASADRGMGFCVFNNIAVAARYAQRRHGIERVLIVDWDIHHGNGTQDIFYEDDSVYFFSTHQWPLYPGSGRADETGAGRGTGFTRNCPFSAGAGHAEVVGAFQNILRPAALEFRPGLILISAGFDSRIGDPLGQFLLGDGSFAELTRLMMGIADECCDGRIVSLLEGGYNLPGLASAVTTHVKTLMGVKREVPGDVRPG